LYSIYCWWCNAADLLQYLQPCHYRKHCTTLTRLSPSPAWIVLLSPRPQRHTSCRQASIVLLSPRSQGTPVADKPRLCSYPQGRKVHQLQTSLDCAPLPNAAKAHQLQTSLGDPHTSIILQHHASSSFYYPSTSFSKSSVDRAPISKAAKAHQLQTNLGQHTHKNVLIILQHHASSSFRHPHTSSRNCQWYR
jgi:hypothetical protein